MISCYSNVPDNWRIIEGEGFPTVKVPGTVHKEDLAKPMSLPTHTCSGSLPPKGEVQQASSWHVRTLQGLKAAHFRPQSPGTAISSPPSTFPVFALMGIWIVLPPRFPSNLSAHVDSTFPNLSHPSGFKFTSSTLPSSAIHACVLSPPLPWSSLRLLNSYSWMILSAHVPLMSGVCVCVAIHQLWSPVPATVFLIIRRLVLRYIFKFSLHLCHIWYATLYTVDTQKAFAKLKGVCVCVCVCVLSHFSHVWLFGTPWTVARQTPLPMGFSRQEYWSGLPNAPVGMATYRDVFCL